MFGHFTFAQISGQVSRDTLKRSCNWTFRSAFSKWKGELFLWHEAAQGTVQKMKQLLRYFSGRMFFGLNNLSNVNVLAGAGCVNSHATSGLGSSFNYILTDRILPKLIRTA